MYFLLDFGSTMTIPKRDTCCEISVLSSKAACELKRIHRTGREVMWKSRVVNCWCLCIVQLNHYNQKIGKFVEFSVYEKLFSQQYLKAIHPGQKESWTKILLWKPIFGQGAKDCSWLKNQSSDTEPTWEEFSRKHNSLFIMQYWDP